MVWCGICVFRFDTSLAVLKLQGPSEPPLSASQQLSLQACGTTLLSSAFLDPWVAGCLPSAWLHFNIVSCRFGCHKWEYFLFSTPQILLSVRLSFFSKILLLSFKTYSNYVFLE